MNGILEQIDPKGGYRMYEGNINTDKTLKTLRNVQESGTVPNALFINNTFSGLRWFPRGIRNGYEFSVVGMDTVDGKVVEDTLIRYSASPYRWRPTKGLYDIPQKDRDMIVDIIKYIMERGYVANITKQSDDIFEHDIITEKHMVLPYYEEMDKYMDDWGYIPIHRDITTMRKPLNMSEDNRYIVVMSSDQLYVYRKMEE